MRLGLVMVTALTVAALGTVNAAEPQMTRVVSRCSGQGKESKNDRGFVKLWIEVKGQLSSIPDLQENDSHGGFVRGRRRVRDAGVLAGLVRSSGVAGTGQESALQVGSRDRSVEIFRPELCRPWLLRNGDGEDAQEGQPALGKMSRQNPLPPEERDPHRSL